MSHDKPMSQATKNNFECLIDEYFLHHSNILHLAKPTFKRDGFITTATMMGCDGRVEMRCGPAEYHAEIFIYTSKDNRRWTLSDLMNIEKIRIWVLKNRPRTLGRSLLETEIDYAFCLLEVGLKDVAGFEWI